jgi:hypothetical protein
MSERDKKRLQASEMKFLRNEGVYRKTVRKQNKEIREELNLFN